jgi:hypothetical protein
MRRLALALLVTADRTSEEPTSFQTLLERSARDLVAKLP